MRARAQLVLLQAGATAFREIPMGLCTYFPEGTPDVPDERELLRRLEVAGIEARRVRFGRAAGKDWEEYWRRGLAPRKIGERIVIRPSWIEREASGSEIQIVLDPGAAFGTGEHATTRGVLELAEPLAKKGIRAVDAGTGSGILAIAMAKLGAAGVDAFDIDPYARMTARENIKRNGATGIARVLETLPLEGPGYDLALANIEWPLLEPLLAPLVSRLARRGRIVLGGVQASQADEALARMGRLGFALMTSRETNGWRAFSFARLDPCKS